MKYSGTLTKRLAKLSMMATNGRKKDPKHWNNCKRSRDKSIKDKSSRENEHNYKSIKRMTCLNPLDKQTKMPKFSQKKILNSTIRFAITSNSRWSKFQ